MIRKLCIWKMKMISNRSKNTYVPVGPSPQFAVSSLSDKKLASSCVKTLACALNIFCPILTGETRESLMALDSSEKILGQEAQEKQISCESWQMSQFPSAYFLNRSGNKQKGTHNSFWFSEVLTDCCNGFLSFAVGEASCLISLLPQLLLWVLPLTHCSENVFLPSRRTQQPPAPRTHQPFRTEVEGKVLPDFSPGMG